MLRGKFTITHKKRKITIIRKIFFGIIFSFEIFMLKFFPAGFSTKGFERGHLRGGLMLLRPLKWHTNINW